jgi:phenylacetyl-CoA:acceptor oxidoreductase subunit 2
MKAHIPGVEPFHQYNWDMRAVGNFTCGSAGGGLFLTAAIGSHLGLHQWPLAVLALILVGIGLICVWLEIGRPMRALHVFFHPQTSWMTREAFVSVPLMAAGGLSVLLAGPFGLWPALPAAQVACAWLAGLIGLGYLVCQAQILFASKGIPVWRHPFTRIVIFITGLTEAIAITAAGATVAGGPATWFALALLIALALRTWSWREMRSRLIADGAPAKALAALKKDNGLILMAGQLLPAVLVILGLYLEAGNWLIALGGLVALAGGWYMKMTIIIRAAFNQGFALPVLPVRGVGVPGKGTKPGWSGGKPG